MIRPSKQNNIYCLGCDSGLGGCKMETDQSISNEIPVYGRVTFAIGVYNCSVNPFTVNNHAGKSKHYEPSGHGTPHGMHGR